MSIRRFRPHQKKLSVVVVVVVRSSSSSRRRRRHRRRRRRSSLHLSQLRSLEATTAQLGWSKCSWEGGGG